MKKLDELVGKWCDRRAFTLLREVLKEYPKAQWLTDDVGQMYECLRGIERIHSDKLVGVESKALTEIVDELAKSLGR